MKTPARILNHPIHPMLIALPIGMWTFALIADAISLLGLGSSDWSKAAFYAINVGLFGALAAALPGIVDYLSIDSGRAKKIATWHMVINLTVVALYFASIILRSQQIMPAGFWVSLAAFLLLGISGWLGGELVYIQRIAVEENLWPGDQHDERRKIA